MPSVGERREFWNRAHAVHDIALLTGSSPEDVLDLHGISPYPRGLRIADIGYGTGTMNEFLSRHNDVTSFDIADIDGVEHIDTLGDSGRFDMGICHLVAQHTPPGSIRSLVPRIKPGGLFSIQFASLDDDSHGFQGGVDWLHTPRQMERYLSRMTVVERRQADMGNRVSWWIFKCKA